MRRHIDGEREVKQDTERERENTCVWLEFVCVFVVIRKQEERKESQKNGKQQRKKKRKRGEKKYNTVVPLFVFFKSFLFSFTCVCVCV